MAYPLRKPVRAFSALTADENSSGVDVWDFDRGEFVAVLVADAVSGTTPTLNVRLQTSPDGGTTWVDIPSAAFTQVTTTDSNQVLVVSNAGILVRAVFDVGGTTPNYNVSLTFLGRGA